MNVRDTETEVEEEMEPEQLAALRRTDPRKFSRLVAETSPGQWVRVERFMGDEDDIEVVL